MAFVEESIVMYVTIIYACAIALGGALRLRGGEKQGFAGGGVDLRPHSLRALLRKLVPSVRWILGPHARHVRQEGLFEKERRCGFERVPDDVWGRCSKQESRVEREPVEHQEGCAEGSQSRSQLENDPHSPNRSVVGGSGPVRAARALIGHWSQGMPACVGLGSLESGGDAPGEASLG